MRTHSKKCWPLKRWMDVSDRQRVGGIGTSSWRISSGKSRQAGWVWGYSRESRVVIAKGQEVRSGGDAGRGSREWG